MDTLQTDPTEPPAPRLLLVKLISSGFSFFVAGINDGSLGALIPYIQNEYAIDTNMVSIVYGTTFAGWLIAALTNSYLSQYFNLGILLLLGAALQILSHSLRVWLPPFALFAVAFCVAALGQAYQDTHANNFVATVKGAHRWLGFIHAMYMAGCLVAPFVATGVASSGESRWHYFYAFPLGLGVVNLILVWVAFREWATLKTSTNNTQSEGVRVRMSRQSEARIEMQKTISSKGVWLLSLFFFFFLGAVITAGGWIVEYLVDVRNGDLDKMGYVPAGFYGGGFLGRLLLAEPTHRFGERRMIFIYIILCLALELVFWLVPDIITEAVAISLLGFFSGPFFATGISVASKLFTAETRSSALAFVFLLGQIGGSVFPAITGVIASEAGVKVLQPMLVGLLGATGVSWLIIPKPRLHHD
ncbi:major facilitator superfamily domain-containing protein [Aspergillus heterothallicus]